MWSDPAGTSGHAAHHGLRQCRMVWRAVLSRSCLLSMGESNSRMRAKGRRGYGAGAGIAPVGCCGADAEYYHGGEKRMQSASECLPLGTFFVHRIESLVSVGVGRRSGSGLIRGPEVNQKDLIKYGLIALGAYLIYEYIQKNGGLSGIFGATVAAGSAPAHPITIGPAPASIPQPSATPTTPTPTPTPQPVTATPPSTPVGTVKTINGLPYSWNGSAWLPVQAVPSPTPSNTPTAAISQQMLNAAGTNSLNMDQWCFYFTAATGQACPVDPGSIDPTVYAGAGIVDRTTPTDVGTWLAIMQNQAPQLGLMGLGVMRFTPAWLM
jgi:hypothetical protein